MTGRPKAYPTSPTPCTGDWACDGTTHCTCWWASTPSWPLYCCQCRTTPERVTDDRPA